MSNMHLSFTATFIQWFHGAIQCTPNNRYRFNCTRENLFFNNLEYVPFEITWVDKKNIHFSHNPFPAIQVDKVILKKFREFQAIILQAEQKHNVIYRKPYKTCIASWPDSWLTEEEKNNPDYMETRKLYFPEN